MKGTKPHISTGTIRVPSPSPSRLLLNALNLVQETSSKKDLAKTAPKVVPPAIPPKPAKIPRKAPTSETGTTTPTVSISIDQDALDNEFTPLTLTRATYSSPTTPIKPLRISQNQKLLGGLATIKYGQISWRKNLKKATKEVQLDATTYEGGLKNRSKPYTNIAFLVQLEGRYREKIFRLLDEKAKSTIRMVSKLFNKEIDLYTGLEVVVNDRLEENIEFIQNVEAIEACIVHLESSFFKDHRQLFRCNWNIETLDFWMPLDTIIYRKLVLDCGQTLECLYLREVALMHRPIFEGKPDTWVNSTFNFPSLTTLIIYYGFIEFKEQSFRIFNSNMKFILTTFDTPRLKNLQVLPEASVIHSLLHEKSTIDVEHCRWEGNHLKHFVSKNRNRLRKLKLIFYRSKLTPEKEYFIPPTQLAECVILFPMLESTNVKEFRNYWRVIVQAQEQVQVLSIQTELWGDVRTMSINVKNSVLLFSAETLTKVYIDSYCRKGKNSTEEIHNLDLKPFASFKCLLELHLTVVEATRRTDLFQVHHLSMLPRQLEVLIINGYRCLTIELLYIAEMHNLKRVTLRRVGNTGYYGVNFDVARALLIHKTITVIGFGGFNEKNDTRHLYALIKKFNKGRFENEFEVVNPREQISFIDWFPCCCCMKPHGEENINVS